MSWIIYFLFLESEDALDEFLQSLPLLDLLREEGVRATFELAPGEAFGERKADMVQWVARKLLDVLGDPQEQYAVGEVVQFPTPDGQGQYAGAVRQVGDDGSVLFDFNHPLASQPVTFEVLVIGVL